MKRKAHNSFLIFDFQFLFTFDWPHAFEDFSGGYIFRWDMGA